jgi:hypothetical protein
VSSKAVSFKEEDWNAVTRFKLLAIHTVLKANRPVLYCDPDIVFVRDPFTSLSLMQSSKIYVQEGSPWCSGVIYAHPKFDLAHLVFGFEHWKHYKLDDEAYIRWRVEQLKRSDCVEVLPFSDYPNGLAWSRYGKSDADIQSLIVGSNCVLFHYNHISGIDAKIARMKLTGAYIPTMKVVHIPSKFSCIQLNDVCKEIRGTSYPPHHYGYHLEESCEWLVKETLKTRLLSSQYTYLPIHWTALAVGVVTNPGILEDLKQYCKSLFNSKPKTKYWTVVQHCKGLYKSCGIEMPIGTRLFMTSDPNHALESSVRPAVALQPTPRPIVVSTVKKRVPPPETPQMIALRKLQQSQQLKRKKLKAGPTQPPQRLLAIQQQMNAPKLQQPQLPHPFPPPPRRQLSSSNRPAHPLPPAPRLPISQKSKIEPEWTTVSLVSSSRNPTQPTSATRDLLASFIGNIAIHPIRQRLKESLSGYADVVIKQGEYRKPDDVVEFEKLMRRSKFALCPRGFGTTSFRLSEAMEFGCIPVYISDVFSLPFSNLIDAKDYCVLVGESEIGMLRERLLAITDVEIERMQTRIKEVYEKYFTMEGCCKTILFDYIVSSSK